MAGSREHSSESGRIPAVLSHAGTTFCQPPGKPIGLDKAFSVRARETGVFGGVSIGRLRISAGKSSPVCRQNVSPGPFPLDQSRPNGDLTPEQIAPEILQGNLRGQRNSLGWKGGCAPSRKRAALRWSRLQAGTAWLPLSQQQRVTGLRFPRQPAPELNTTVSSMPLAMPERRRVRWEEIPRFSLSRFCRDLPAGGTPLRGGSVQRSSGASASVPPAWPGTSVRTPQAPRWQRG